MNKTNNELKVFEAFSGYGSQRLACNRYNIPHKSVGIAEIDIYAIQSYANLHEKNKVDNYEINLDVEDIKKELMQCNVGFDFKKGKSAIPKLSKKKLIELYKCHKVSNNFGDISLLESNSLPDMDLFTYSFPCTDLSVAGKQKGMVKGSGTSSSLIWECEKVIDIKRPKVLMMENVKALTFKKNMHLFQVWLNILESYGYNNYWKIINAKDCDIPQNRERIFCVSILKEFDNNTFEFLEDKQLNKHLIDILEDEVDEKYYIENENAMKLINIIKDGKKGHTPNYHGEPLITSALSSREHRGQGWKDISGTLCARDYKDPKVVCVDSTLCKPKELDIANCITARYDAGIQNKQSIGVAVIEKVVCEQRSDEGLRFFNDNICGTLRTIDSCGDKRILEIERSYRLRKLTPRECFRLMGLLDYEIDLIQETNISNSQQYKMAGNSIVVNCMEFLRNVYDSVNLE